MKKLVIIFMLIAITISAMAIELVETKDPAKSEDQIALNEHIRIKQIGLVYIVEYDLYVTGKLKFTTMNEWNEIPITSTPNKEEAKLWLQHYMLQQKTKYETGKDLEPTYFYLK